MSIQPINADFPIQSGKCLTCYIGPGVSDALILEEVQSDDRGCTDGEDVNVVRLGTLENIQPTVPARYCTVHTGPGASPSPSPQFLI